jgi:hypothetical protein
LIEDGVCNCSTVSITVGDDDRPQNHLPNHETAFNIHNPSLDHRDRGKRLRLPSHLQIESVSPKVIPNNQSSVCEALPILASGDSPAT